MECPRLAGIIATQCHGLGGAGTHQVVELQKDDDGSERLSMKTVEKHYALMRGILEEFACPAPATSTIQQGIAGFADAVSLFAVWGVSHGCACAC